MKGFTGKWLEKRTGTKLPKRKASEADKAIRKVLTNKHQEKFAALWTLEGHAVLYPYYGELRFSDSRKYRFDVAWPELKVALEVDGLIWGKGGHTSGTGKTRDCEKDFLAVQEGWTVIRWVPSMLTKENVDKLRKILSDRS